MKMIFKVKSGLAALAVLLATACGGGDSGDDGVEPDAGNAGPAYLIGTRVWDDSSTTSYFHVAESIEAGKTLDPARALEVPGAAKLFAVGDLGWFAIGGGEAPTITRYTLDGDALVAGDTISLQPYGVDSLWDTVYVVSETKAYYPDRDGQQLIVWNPTTMEITGTIDLAQTGRAGHLALYGYAAIRRGDELLFTVGWFDWSENDRVLGETGLVVIDTTTDTVARFDVDIRCGGITQAITTAGGDTYLVSSALAAAAFRLERMATEPCALRVRAGEGAIDPAFHVQLSELTGGSLGGEPVAAAGDRLFLRVFDETLATVARDDATWELTGQLAWHWYVWDVGATLASRVTSLPPSTADVLWFQVDGRVFGTQTTADYSETTLVELTADGGPRPAMTTPGFLHGLARVR